MSQDAFLWSQVASEKSLGPGHGARSKGLLQCAGDFHQGLTSLRGEEPVSCSALQLDRAGRSHLTPGFPDDNNK
jgi:hypothetical protein